MGKEILLIEDEIELIKNLEKVLADEKYRVTSASNGQMALDLAKKKKFDLIITDLKLPQLSGVEFLAEARKLSENCKTPVIIISGNMSEFNAELALYDELVLLSKPFGMDKFIKEVKSSLLKANEIEVAEEGDFKTKILNSYQMSLSKMMSLISKKSLEQTGPTKCSGPLVMLHEMNLVQNIFQAGLLVTVILGLEKNNASVWASSILQKKSEQLSEDEILECMSRVWSSLGQNVVKGLLGDGIKLNISETFVYGQIQDGSFTFFPKKIESYKMSLSLGLEVVEAHFIFTICES